MKLGKSIQIGLPAFLLAMTVATADAQDWLRFRGPSGSGVSTEKASTVTEFDDEKNIVWKIELPGAGASAPIVVGDKVIVTCYSGYGQSRQSPGDMDNLKRHVVCFNKKDGKKLWQKDLDSYLPEDPFRGMGVPEHGYASNSPVSDGERVYAFFGKTGVIAFDLDGKELWKKSVGTKSGRMKWGSGGSLVLAGNVIIVNASDEDASLVGLDKMTGKEIWKNSEIDNVWGTPIMVGDGDDAVLVFSIPYEIWGMNPKNGKLKWFSTNGIQDGSVSASVVADEGVVYAIGGQSRTAVAIRAGGDKGADVTKTHTLWEGRAAGRIVTPVVFEGHVYGINGGVATCVKTSDGERVYQERLAGGSGGGGRRRGGGTEYCSPVIADGKIYQFTKSGTCYVVAASPEFKLLATNKFENDGSEFNSTPAVSEGKLFVRSNKYLYCIGE